jgi:hypothetical protein
VDDQDGKAHGVVAAVVADRNHSNNQKAPRADDEEGVNK